jgi:UDP-N-acetyl-D-galactosamine dehydrogenase
MEKLSVIGMGYVGLPLAVAFAEAGNEVLGFDINSEKIKTYKNGIDPTNEVGNERLRRVNNIKYTSCEKDLRESKFHIVAVPTPVREDKTPDLKPVEGASEIVGRNLTKGSIIVYESTVYPGVTEEICVPILEKESGLKCGRDFKVGYSPERINPGDKVHRVETIVKIVSGMDEESLERIAKKYEEVIKAGVHRASSIKVAEAAKVIENSQRDINIAFVNELAIIFEKMGIDTLEVLEAAGTKWNFLPFKPGLVGGHCIGIDPYYLTYKSKILGYEPEVILSGRKINDNMGKWVAQKVIKEMIKSDVQIKGSKVLIMGLTFKEDCPDLRNSKVVDIIKELKEFGIESVVYDPVAEKREAMKEYGIELKEKNEIEDVSGVIIAVKHEQFKNIKIEDMKKFYKKEIREKVIIDVKGLLDKEEIDEEINYKRV